MSGSRSNVGHAMHRVFRTSFLVCLLSLGGCASFGQSNPFTEASNKDGYLLRVESRNTYDVKVYVVPAGRRELLGTVPANGLEFFQFEYPRGRPLNIELETRIGDRYRLPAAPFMGGGRVDLMAAGTLRNSYFVNRSSD